MDEAVKSLASALMLTLALSAGAAAQALQDPTRPPAAAGVGAAATASTGPQLQTILVGRGAGARHLAVIDGETVRIGDSFQGARVARIGDDQVELVRGRERKVLRLYGADAVRGGMTPAAPTGALATAQR
jgi:MSHA biogenesis protein MshK